jgi:uncharacterized membrane protein
MQPKRSKYDTNPLDEKVADRAEKSWSRDTAAHAKPPTENVGGATRDIGRTANEAARTHPETEAPTRRIDDSYPSVFAYGQSRQATYQSPQTPFADIYQPPPVPLAQIYQAPPSPALVVPGSRKVAGVGIAEKWVVIAPYTPFYLGLIASLVELLLVPRTEKRARFHAAQGFALQIGITAISTMLRVAGVLSGVTAGGSLFRFAAFVFLIISMIRVWKGKPHHIAILDQPANWVNEKIGPRK